MFKPKAKWTTKAPSASSAGFWRDTPPASRNTAAQRSTQPHGTPAPLTNSRGSKETVGPQGTSQVQRRLRLRRPSPALLLALVLASIGAGVVMLGARGCFTRNAHTCWLRGERALFALREWRGRHGELAGGLPGAEVETLDESLSEEAEPQGQKPHSSGGGDNQQSQPSTSLPEAGTGRRPERTDAGSKARVTRPAVEYPSDTNAIYNETELFLRAMETEELPYTIADPKNDEFSENKNRKARGLAKIAFLFLTRGPLPLAKMWARFLATAKDAMPPDRAEETEHLFSIYIHTAKAFRYSPGDIPDVFVGRRIPSEDIKWGGISMIDAERRLLAQALLDPLNQRFVLVSDSCIPLFNFTFVYDYLMYTEVSFLRGSNYKGAAGTGRWNRGFLPLVPVESWRKGNQWFSLTRDAARLVVGDDMYYPVFRDHCRSCPRAQCNPPSCYSDEHYIQTLLYSVVDDSRLDNRSVTWIDWSRGGPHPMSFDAWEIGTRVLDKVRAKPHCTWNGVEASWCYLFARKFKQDTIHALLKWSHYLGY